MVTFLKLDKNLFLIYSPAFATETHDVYYQGPLEDAVETLRWCNIPDSEINYVLERFKTQGDNYADFGVNHLNTFTKRVFTRTEAKKAA